MPLLHAQPIAHNGVMDLRAIDFEDQSFIELNGEWSFYPGQILAPDTLAQINQSLALHKSIMADWGEIDGLHNRMKEFGYTTCVLKLIMPDVVQRLSLKIDDINTAYRLYVNGEEILRRGKVGTTAMQSIPLRGEVSRPVNLHVGENQLVLIMSNFEHSSGGLSRSIKLMPTEEALFLQNIEIGGVLFLTGCLLLAGIFALGLFWFRTSDISGLLFFFFCSFYAYWILSSDNHVIQFLTAKVPWTLSFRMEYGSLFLSVIVYAYFIKSTFEEIFKPVVFHGMAILNGIMLIITLSTPVWFFTLLMPYYYGFLMVSFLVLGLSSLEYSKFSHKLAWLNLVGFTSLFLVILNNLVVHFDLMREIPLFNIGGNIIFIFSQALVMAIKFGRQYRESSLAALAAARTRDEFLNTMSHELKTPMNAILGMTTFLEKSKLDQNQRSKLKAIRQNSESLMSMITDVLSIAEVDTGQMTLKKSILNIESCIESAISLSRQHLNKGVKFTYFIDPKIPSLLRGDASRIKQILMHLLSNAFKFTEKGSVRLEVRLGELNEEGVELRFSLIDTGKGMNLSNRKNIFGIFNQEQKGNTRAYGGTGLGLTVTRELLHLMGGDMTLRSQKNLGTQVDFHLRLEEYVPGQKVTSIFERDEIDTSLKILYAEDNPVNQKLITMMLQNLNLNVDIARNGQEAVQMAMKKYYNIILMDIQMPVMDGFEASMKIVQNSSARPIIIATTANLAEIDKRKCFEAGMNDFLSKPIYQDELKLVIIKWQGLKKYLDDSTDERIKLSS